MSLKEINKAYLEIMKQMDIDFYNDLSLIKELKANTCTITTIQESLNFERESFFTKYSWTVIPIFFHIEAMRKVYLSKSAERCTIIWNEIYNS